MDGDQCVAGDGMRGRKPSLAMPTPSRKHPCLFGQAVGRGQLCGVPTATNRRWFLRAEGKQSSWLLEYAPGVMGQLWNIPGSEGGAPEASGSECEVEVMSWRAREEPAAQKPAPAGQLGLSLPQGGSWSRDIGDALLRSSWQPLCDGRKRHRVS